MGSCIPRSEGALLATRGGRGCSDIAQAYRFGRREAAHPIVLVGSSIERRKSDGEFCAYRFLITKANDTVSRRHDAQAAADGNGWTVQACMPKRRDHAKHEIAEAISCDEGGAPGEAIILSCWGQGFRRWRGGSEREDAGGVNARGLPSALREDGQGCGFLLSWTIRRSRPHSGAAICKRAPKGEHV